MKPSLKAMLAILTLPLASTTALAAGACWYLAPQTNNSEICIKGTRLKEGCGGGGSTLSKYFIDNTCLIPKSTNRCWYLAPQTDGTKLCVKGTLSNRNCGGGGGIANEYYDNNICKGPAFTKYSPTIDEKNEAVTNAKLKTISGESVGAPPPTAEENSYSHAAQ